MRPTEMVTAVQTQGGFDPTSSATSPAVILSWLNARYSEMCAESGFTQARRELGVTVAGQAEYALSAGIVRLKSLRVNGSRPWTPLKLDDLWELAAGTAYLEPGVAGGFAETWSEASFSESEGNAKVQLWPVPTEAGWSLEGLCVVLPPVLSVEDNAAPLIPADFHEYLVEGAIAMGLRRDDEREDGAAPYEARFKDAIARLAARGRKRVGRGPVQGRVAGVHF